MWGVWILTYILCVRGILTEYGTYKFNLIGKLTNQSSVFSQKTSEKAVDGNTDNNLDHGSCTHTDPQERNPWWAVDMESLVTVFSVDLTNRGDCCGNRLDEFSIYGSNNSFNPYQDGDKQLCRSVKGKFGNAATKTFKCDQPITARYLSVLRSPAIITLCEVEVRAVCPDGTYGEECVQNCSQNCKNPPCDKFTEDGACPNEECKSGFKSNNCSEECPLGTHGDRCKFKCNSNCKNECSQQTGHCNEGCNPGYTGDTCERECLPNFFGQDCNEECHCKNGTCHHVTGLDCPGGCAEGYKGDNCSETLTTTTEMITQRQTGNSGKPPSVPIIAGAVVGVIMVIVLVVAVVFITRRRRKKKPKTETTMVYENDLCREIQQQNNVEPQIPVKPKLRESSPSTSSQELLDETTDTGQELEITEGVYANVTGEDSKTKLKLKDVGAFINTQKSQKRPFFDEYDDIPKKTASWSEAGVDALKSKNRYINILPYNHNRVKLKQIDDNPLSSYINASYIKDYDGNISYIAAMGSTDKTLNDNWRMIWEAGISNIVMVTNLMEESKTKCIQYWPFGKSAQYGEICVTLEKEEHHTHYVKRTMKASRGKESKTVTHHHYTAWPDKKAPSSLSSVLHLRETVKSLRLQRDTPILIHCSAGIGRTGTLIALDILMDQVKKEDAIDVYKCVTKLREQRTQMVQTLEQYVFLYNTFHELFEVGKTVVPMKNIGSYVESGTFQTEATKQYSFLESIKPEIPAEELIFGKLENAEKNRDVNVVAGEEQRIILMSDPDRYINAVYVPDYKKARAYCATQLPLQDTVRDFWKMVFELKSVAVVCLEIDFSDTWKFLPENVKPIVTENIQVILTEAEEEAGVTINHIDISTNVEYANIPVKQESDDFHQLKLYELKSWTSASVEDRDFAPLWKIIKHIRKDVEREDRRPVTVMCKNGATETGVYIALSILVDNMRAEHEADVFQVVKMIRTNWPEFIVSQDQYTWLYHAIAEVAHHK